MIHKLPSFLIGFSFLFMYWDKKASVLEIFYFGKVKYYYIQKENHT